MKTTNQVIGEKLKAARLKAGLTQTEVATRLGLSSPMFVHLLESGKSKVPFKTLGQLSIILGFKAEPILNLILGHYAQEKRLEFEAGKKSPRG